MEGILDALFRSLGNLIFKVLFKTLFYYTGFLVCRILTLGQYPKLIESDVFDAPSSLLMAALGLLIHMSVAFYLVLEFA